MLKFIRKLLLPLLPCPCCKGEGIEQIGPMKLNCTMCSGSGKHSDYLTQREEFVARVNAVRL
jgi:DnaJ-class molecular chaperone